MIVCAVVVIVVTINECTVCAYMCVYVCVCVCVCVYVGCAQISQFVVDIAFAAMYPFLKKWKWTHGDDGPFMLGNFIGITFIVLFLQVYFSIARESESGTEAAALIARKSKAADKLH